MDALRMRIIQLEARQRVDDLRITSHFNAMQRDHRANQQPAEMPALPQVTVGDRATATPMRKARRINHQNEVRKGEIDFYGPVRFWGTVEFIPEDDTE